MRYSLIVASTEESYARPRGKESIYEPTVGVSWFVSASYPHKGHDDVVDAENILYGAFGLALMSNGGWHRPPTIVRTYGVR